MSSFRKVADAALNAGGLEGYARSLREVASKLVEFAAALEKQAEMIEAQTKGARALAEGGIAELEATSSAKLGARLGRKVRAIVKGAMS